MKGKSMLVSVGVRWRSLSWLPGLRFRPGQVHAQSAEWARVLRVQGYEGWQTISISENGGCFAVILGTRDDRPPIGGVPVTASLSPTAPKCRRSIGNRKERDSPRSAAGAQYPP